MWFGEDQRAHRDGSTPLFDMLRRVLGKDCSANRAVGRRMDIYSALGGKGDVDMSMHHLAPTIDSLIRSGVTEGVELYVSVSGRRLLDVGVGKNGSERPIPPQGSVPWSCCSKISSSISVGRLIDQGALSLSDPVATHIPEFSGPKRDEILLEHLMTHTVGFPGDPAERLVTEDADPRAVVKLLCEIPLIDDWPPGARAAYKVWTNAFLVAEVIRRVSGLTLGEFEATSVELAGVRRSVLKGKSPPGTDIPTHLYRRVEPDDGLSVDPLVEALTEREWPWISARGSVRELARLSETLLGTAMESDRVVSAATRHLLTSPRRVGIVDESVGGDATWGVGMVVDGRVFGRMASSRTFGYLGGDYTAVFADPERSLVVAMFFNTRATTMRALIRRHAVSDAIYRDLGFSN